MAFNSVATNPGVLPFVAAQTKPGYTTPPVAPSPVPPAQGAPIMPMAFPAVSTTTTAPTNGSSLLVRDKFTNAADAKFEQANTAQLANADLEIARANATNEAAITQAHAEAAEIQDAAARRKAVEEERARALLAHQAEERRQQASVDAAAKPTGYMEDRSVFQRVLSGLVLGAAAAVGAKEPFAIYQQYAAEDRQKKMDRLAAETDKLARMGKNRTELMAMYQDRIAQIDREELTNNKLLLKQAEVMRRTIPGAAVEAEKLKANIQMDSAQKEQKRTEEFAKRSTFQSGGRSQTINEDPNKVPGGSEPKVTEAEAKKAEFGNQILNNVKLIRSSERINDKELGKLHDNIRSIMNQAENATKGLAGEARVRALQAIGWSPKTFTDGIPKSKKPAALALLNGSGLIIRNQSGAAVLNWEDVRNSQLKIPQPGEGAAIYDQKINTMESEGQDLLNMAGPEANRRLKLGAGGYDAENARKAATQATRAQAVKTSQPATSEELDTYRQAKKVKLGEPYYDDAQNAIREIEPRIKDALTKRVSAARGGR